MTKNGIKAMATTQKGHIGAVGLALIAAATKADAKEGAK